jgi:hypothetical protein
MEFKPLVLAALFIVLLFVLLNPPGSGGDKKHDDHGDRAGGKGAPKKY